MIMENFEKEEAGRAIIIEPNADINSLADKWGRETQRMDLNVIIFKNMQIFRVLPLIDARDYQSWVRFKRSDYQNIIAAFKPE